MAQEPTAGRAYPQRVVCQISARIAGQLSAKLKAGLAPGPALYAVSVESKNREVGEALKAVKAGVEQGRSLGECMRSQAVFDEIFIRLVDAGEARGRLLPEVQRAASYLATTARLDELSRSSGPQPLKLGGIALLVYLISVGVATPWVERSLHAAGHAQWSVLTHAAIHAAGIIRSVLPFVLGGLVLIAGLRFWGGQRHKVVLWWDKLLLGLPLVGAISRTRAVADFNRATGALLAAGLPATEAMKVAARSSRNRVVRGAVLYEADRLSQARDMAGVLVEGGLVPRRELNALQAAERRGDMGTMLSNLATQYDAELQARLLRLKGLVQSTTILVLALLIAFAMLALYVPAFIEH